eukprot:scaffold322161_cov43-Prasinocladus_malaysianus.AAC.1
MTWNDFSLKFARHRLADNWRHSSPGPVAAHQSERVAEAMLEAGGEGNRGGSSSSEDYVAEEGISRDTVDSSSGSPLMASGEAIGYVSSEIHLASMAA